MTNPMTALISWLKRHEPKAQAIQSLPHRDGSFVVHASEIKTSYATLTVSVDGTWISIEVTRTGTSAPLVALELIEFAGWCVAALALTLVGRLQRWAWHLDGTSRSLTLRR